MEIWLLKPQHSSVLKAQPRQRISHMVIYLYVSDQSVYSTYMIQKGLTDNKHVTFLWLTL